jgi:hypothetical protein
MTEERRAKLLENLKRGRETAKLNRQKRAEYKKILKQNEKKKIDDVLIQDLEKRNNKKNKDNENEKLKKEIENLKKELDQKKNITNIKKEDVKPKEEKVVVNPPPKIIIQEPPKKIISTRLKKGSRWK